MLSRFVIVVLANFANLESIIAIAVPAEGDSVQPTSGRVSPTALGCFPPSQLCLTERVAGGRCSFMSFRNCVLEASDHPLLDVRTTALSEVSWLWSTVAETTLLADRWGSECELQHAGHVRSDLSRWLLYECRLRAGKTMMRSHFW